ncbi:MAG: hypothetical protein ACE5JG_13345, partial [Planctomycetota bacterium]
MGRRLLCLPVVAALAAAPCTAARAGSYRAATTDAGEVRGPLSDFWFKVRSEWAGDRQPEPGPPPGGGFLRERTLSRPAPNRAWVSLV